MNFILGSGDIKLIEKICFDESAVNLCIIDCDVERVKNLLLQMPGLASSVILAANEVELSDNERFRQMSQRNFKILIDSASFVANKVFFEKVERLLVARDRMGFFLALRSRPELLAIIDAKEIEKLAAAQGDGLISIKHLQKMFRDDVEHTLERRKWRVLEELIK